MPVQIRPAGANDAEALGRMGAALARLHHQYDPERFLLPEGVEAGYRAWLAKEARNEAAVVLVAELGGVLVGYAYGRVEARDWNLLLDAHGALHDLWVEPNARRTGAGGALAREAIRLLRGKGAPRIVLHTAHRNEEARRFWERLGFRPTMVELTLEAAP